MHQGKDAVLHSSTWPACLRFASEQLREDTEVVLAAVVKEQGTCNSSMWLLKLFKIQIGSAAPCENAAENRMAALFNTLLELRRLQSVVYQPVLCLDGTLQADRSVAVVACLQVLWEQYFQARRVSSQGRARQAVVLSVKLLE